MSVQLAECVRLGERVGRLDEVCDEGILDVFNHPRACSLLLITNLQTVVSTLTSCLEQL